jgi:hypothetical protein
VGRFGVPLPPATLQLNGFFPEVSVLALKEHAMLVEELTVAPDCVIAYAPANAAASVEACNSR